MPFIGQQPLTGAYSKLDSITTSATATYNLQLDSAAYSPASANHLLVSLNGVMQAPQDSFTVSGSTITFASALTSSDNIDFIMALGDVLNIGTPSDGTVTAAKIGSGAVTAAKIATNAVSTAKIAASAVTDAKIATGITASKLTGALPAISGASLTNLPASGTLKKAQVVYNNSTRQVFSTSRGALLTSENFCTPSNGYHHFTYTKSSASSTLVFHLSLSVGDVENQHAFGLWKTDTQSPANGVANFQRMAFDGSRNMGQGTSTSTVMGAVCNITGLAAQEHHFFFAFGRSNDGSNVGYTLNPDTNNGSDKSGATNSQVVIYEIEI